MTGTASVTFRFRHPVEVRFRDLDPMGHAHHSLPLVYFEEARAAYWRQIADRGEIGDIDYVMGSVTVAVRVSRLGGSSFDMEYELRDAAGALLATGSSVQVMYDYAAERTRPLPDGLRRAIAAYEGIAERD